MAYTFREAEPYEYDKVAALREDEGPEIFEDQKKRNFLKFFEIEDGLRKVLFAENENGRVIGSVQIEFDKTDKELADGKNILHLDALRVNPSFRRMKIGTGLMYEAEKEARSRGFSKITLGIRRDESYDFLRKMYENLGYEFIKDKDDGTASIFAKEL